MHLDTQTPGIYLTNQNFGAGAGLGGVAAFAGANCLFHQNCDLSFRPSLGAAVDANGQIVPQLGVTTQVSLL